jgi:hypothetical protein
MVVLVLKVSKSVESFQAFVAMCVVIEEVRNIATVQIILPIVQKLQTEVVHVPKAKRGAVLTLKITFLESAQMFAATNRLKKPVTTMMILVLLLMLLVHLLPMVAAHAQKIK